jgi:hypothetical protein
VPCLRMVTQDWTHLMLLAMMTLQTAGSSHLIRSLCEKAALKSQGPGGVQDVLDS